MPAIRKIVFTAALCLVLLPLRAQHFSAYIGPQFQDLNSNTFRQFRSSYNTHFAGDLRNELSPGLGRGMLYGLSFGALSGNVEGNPFFFALEYSRTSQMNKATFTDDAVRRLKLKNNVFSFNIGLNFGIRLYEGESISHYLYIRPETGLGMGSSKIIADFNSGTSGKKDLNIDGTYKCLSGNAHAGMGLTYMVGFVGVKFYYRYNTQFAPTGMHNPDRETGEDRLYLNIADFTNGMIGDEVRNDFKYWQFGIGLVFGASPEDD